MTDTYKSADDYISAQSEKIQDKLIFLRKIIKEAAPMAEEVISYQMPGYRFMG